MLKYLLIFFVVFLSLGNEIGAQSTSSETSGHIQAKNPPDKIESILKELKKNMDTVKTLSASFIQKKQLLAFEKELEIKGEIFLKPPNWLAWHVKCPVKYRMVLKGDTLYQWDETTEKVQKLNLENKPEFSYLQKQMALWFSGNYTPLLKEYSVKLLNTNPFCLRFYPYKETVAADILCHLTITFNMNNGYLKRVKILEKNQDITILQFYNTEINIHLDNNVWKVDGGRI